MYGTVRRYVHLGMDTVCRYVLLGIGTVRIRHDTVGTHFLKTDTVGALYQYAVLTDRTHVPHPYPYPHRTRTHGTYLPYVPVPTRKALPSV